jgi:hypothetical protein
MEYPNGGIIDAAIFCVGQMTSDPASHHLSEISTNDSPMTEVCSVKWLDLIGFAAWNF